MENLDQAPDEFEMNHQSKVYPLDQKKSVDRSVTVRTDELIRMPNTMVYCTRSYSQLIHLSNSPGPSITASILVTSSSLIRTYSRKGQIVSISYELSIQ